MRLAAIDVGTNSVLLTVVDGELRPVVERATITRLGQDVDRTRALSPAAAERTLACLAEYAEVCRAEGVTELSAVGTSALRDAAGADVFTREAERVLGVPLGVISGDDEAQLTFEGALSGLSCPGRVLVFDVGGGSTELIVGRGEDVERAVSLDVGSVRLFERHLASDPPTEAELARVREDVRRALSSQPPPGPLDAVVGVAGTVTTLLAIELELDRYDAGRVHGETLKRATVRALARRLAELPLARRRRLPGLEPGRADVIVVGALLVEELLEFSCKSELIVSDRGVRWGLLGRRARELQGLRA